MFARETLKFGKFFFDKCPCSKTGVLVFEQGDLSRKNCQVAKLVRVDDATKMARNPVAGYEQQRKAGPTRASFT